jgi:hypothetical protein
LKYCGIDQDDLARLKKLRQVPVEKVVDAIQGVGVFLHHRYRDEKFWPKGFPTYFTEDALIGGCEWVNEVIIGDAFFESNTSPSSSDEVTDSFLGLASHSWAQTGHAG